MANKKELPQEMPKALESHQPGDVSGGVISHCKIDGKDKWFVFPDLERFEPNPLGAVGMKKHGKFSGPYNSAEEAIEAAKSSGCLSTDIVEWDDLYKKVNKKQFN